MKPLVYQAIINLQNQGLIGEFALGGSVAFTCYAAPIPTNDIDFFVLHSGSGLIVDSTMYYEWARAQGFTFQGEHFIIDGVKVNIFPTDDPLFREAIRSAVPQMICGVSIPIILPEYLIALALVPLRLKDMHKIGVLLDHCQVNEDRLAELIQRFNLEAKWARFEAASERDPVLPQFQALEDRKADLREREAALTLDQKMQYLITSLANYRNLKAWFSGVVHVKLS
jgi:hypothetical protein